VILYFVRHGRAAAGGDDDTRALTAEGIAALEEASVLWRRLNLRPAVVITSPLIRARQTADLIGDGLGLDRVAIPDDRLRPGAGWPQLAQAMADQPDARRVLFVGHEPDLSSAVALLSGATSVRLRPGAVACLEFPGVPEPGAGEIAWLLDPDLYTDAG
jgi:phosphohistidine phosphatase